MIKRIKSISNFGIFSCFKWDPNTPDFEKCNIIYGWNYSGKTTLSRILRAFENGERHPDFPGSATVVTAQGDEHEYGTQIPAQPVRVFNPDFIRDNIRWDIPEGMEPIFMIGEENIRLEKELMQMRSDIQVTEQDAFAARRKASSLDETLEKALTDAARPIRRDWPEMSTFDKTHLRALVETVDSEGDRLSDARRTDLRKKYTSTEPLSSLEKLPDLSADGVPQIEEAQPGETVEPDNATEPGATLEQAATLLSTKVTVDTIDRLQSDPELSEWVRKGVEFHKGRDSCQFCEGRLPPGFLTRLAQHFSDEYTKHIQDIDRALESIKALEYAVDSSLRNVAVYADLRAGFIDAVGKVEGLAANWNSAIKRIGVALESKRRNPLLPVAASEPPLTAELDKAISMVNAVIDEHNRRCTNLDAERAEARDALLQDEAVAFAQDNDYQNTRTEANGLRNQVEQAAERTRKLKDKCDEIERMLSDSQAGAESVNSHLRTFFGKDDIEIHAKGDGKFDLLRGDRLAKNLSTGERTAISLAYFMAGLQQRGVNLAETIVFVDDPISSLDSNHLFNAYALLRHELAGAKQVFIATHNLDFLDLLKNWKRDKNKEKEELHERDVRYYLLQSTGGDAPRLTELPRLLRQFGSEYMYLFSLLYDYHTAPADNQERQYILANVARKFLETFAAMKIPSTGEFVEKLRRLAGNDPALLSIERFIHKYSHARAGRTGVRYPDMAELCDIVGKIFDLVKAIDEVHYKALVEEVTKP